MSTQSPALTPFFRASFTFEELSRLIRDKSVGPRRWGDAVAALAPDPSALDKEGEFSSAGTSPERWHLASDILSDERAYDKAAFPMVIKEAVYAAREYYRFGPARFHSGSRTSAVSGSVGLLGSLGKYLTWTYSSCREELLEYLSEAEQESKSAILHVLLNEVYNEYLETEEFSLEDFDGVTPYFIPATREDWRNWRSQHLYVAATFLLSMKKPSLWNAYKGWLMPKLPFKMKLEMLAEEFRLRWNGIGALRFPLTP